MTDILNARTPVPAPTPDVLSTVRHHLATGERPVRTETIAAAVARIESLQAALECYRKRNGKMRVCVDYPTARCNAADCARTGCAKVGQLVRGVVVKGLDGE